MFNTIRNATIYKSYSEAETAAGGSGAVEVAGPESMGEPTIER
jgi:hypothetical protein